MDKLTLYTLLLVSIVAWFILFPRIGQYPIVNKILTKGVLLNIDNIYGLDYRAIFLIAGFIATLFILFLIMKDFEKKSENFVREIKERL